MHDMPTRREKQLEKFNEAAQKGRTSLIAILYSSEAKRWLRKGITFNSDEVQPFNLSKGLGIYKMSFNHPHLLNSPEVNRYLCGNGKMPTGLSYGEQLFLIAQKNSTSNTQ